MLLKNHDIQIYEKDNIIREIISTFLENTSFAETKNITFNELIKKCFIDDVTINFTNVYKSIVLLSDLNNDLWFTATTSTFADKNYATIDNVFNKYYSLKINHFLEENKKVLVNQFILKYCEEKEIRADIIDKILGEVTLDTNIGTILGKYLQEEIKAREEEKKNTTYTFYVYSKERYTLTLPELTDKKFYKIKLDDNVGMNELKDNQLIFTPSTVESTLNTIIEIQTLDSDLHIVKRDYALVTIYPQKYKIPLFKHYKIEKLTSLKIKLPEIESPYTFKASVDDGFGSVDTETESGYLIYTAPDVIQPLDVTVSLSLIWNDDITVYTTGILFKIQLTNEDVDQDEQ